MPTKKKKFINRKDAVTFHVVHRSQKDPLVADESAPKHVLVEDISKEKENSEIRRKEQEKYGIYFDDDYDYLKHLKTADSIPEGETVLERVRIDGTYSKNKVDVLQLPSSVFQSTVEEEEGLLNRIPIKGPRPDWDPDIVAALDDPDVDDPDDLLEDDFIRMANGAKGMAESDEEITEGREGDDELEDIPSDEGEHNDYYFGSSNEEEEHDTKSRFSRYSLTSSNLPRSEQLEFLDDKFEKMLEKYETDEIGSLDTEEILGYIHPNNVILTQMAEEFEKQKKTSTLQEVREQLVGSDGEATKIEETLLESDEFATLEEEPSKADRWDCESILSTYSNHSNHPKLITEPKKVPIKISEKTGLPTSVLATHSLTKQRLRKLQRISISDEDSTDDEISREKSVPHSHRSTASTVRSKNETPEERRVRKTAVKLMRKERRVEKKCNKLAFKEEKKQQTKITQNIVHNLKSIKLV